MFAPPAVALALVVFCSVVMARDLDQDEALRLRQQGVILPLEQLLQQAMDRYPGAKLLEAELEEKHDVYIYEVELLTAEGVVRELRPRRRHRPITQRQGRLIDAFASGGRPRAPGRRTDGRPQRQGYAVDWLADGRDAVYQGSSEPYDLIILDLGLPGVAGA